MKELYYSKNLIIKELSKFFFLFFLSVGIFFSVSLIPESLAANPNLFISAENSQFDNYMSGPQIIEVVVIDSDINDTHVVKGEPDVTVNGKILRMVQAVDGNWYGYFADKNMATLADSTTGVAGQGLDFGYFCSSSVTMANSGDGSPLPVDFTDTIGIAIDQPIGSAANGGTIGAPVNGTISADCGSSISGNSTDHMNVIREEKDVNPGVAGVSAGQIGIDESLWPFIQLYNMTQYGNVAVQYNKGGGNQTTFLTFDTVNQFTQLQLDKVLYAPNTDVAVSITDPWLNIDPTDQDSWTFGTFGVNSTNYLVFNEHGNQVGDAVVGGVIDISSFLDDLMCSTACVLSVNPDVNQTGFVLTLQDNVDSALIVGGNSTDPQNPLHWSTSGNNLLGTIPITFVEQGPNTGFFGSFDENFKSNILVTNDAFSNSTASITYNEITAVVTVFVQECPTPPQNGNWEIIFPCQMTTNHTINGNVLVHGNSVLTIPAGVTLTITSGNNITIESESGVLIKSGGTLKILS